MTLLESHAALIGALEMILDMPPWCPSQEEMDSARKALDEAKRLQEEKNRAEGFDEFSPALPDLFGDHDMAFTVEELEADEPVCDLCCEPLNGEAGNNHKRCEDYEAFIDQNRPTFA